VPKDLTPKQKRFCEEYIKDCNATQSYIRAGYKVSADVAWAAASRLLGNVKVQAYIQELQGMRSSRTQIDADRVLTELAKIAFSDIKNVFELTEEGLGLKPLDQMSDEVSGAIESLECVTTETEAGSRTVVKVRLHSKLSALGAIAKLIGMDKEAAIKAVIGMGYLVVDPRTNEAVAVD